MVLNKQTVFCKISPSLFYYRAADKSFPLAIEIFENCQDFEFILKKYAQVKTAEEMK